MSLRATLLAIAAALAVLPCLGQLRIGVKGGITSSKLHFDKSLFESSNRTGFTGGLQLEFSLPVTGLSLNGSLLYTHRTDAFTNNDQTFSRDYIEVPVHVKYGITIMGLNKVLVPYAFTGPNFSFLLNESKQEQWDNRASNTSWDAGFGVELLGHLQIQASYGLGLTRSFKQIIPAENANSVHGRDHCWTVTAAYMF